MGTVSCTSLQKAFDSEHSLVHACFPQRGARHRRFSPASSFHSCSSRHLLVCAHSVLSPAAFGPFILLQNKRSMSVITPPPLASVQGAELEDLTGKQSTIKSDDLWKAQAVLLLVLRRPGCVLCRGEAKSLWGKKAQFEELGVRMVCLVHEAIPDEIKAFWPEYW